MSTFVTTHGTRAPILLVRNYPSTFEEFDVYMIFKNYGEVDNIRMGNRDGDFCIIMMSSILEVENVLSHLNDGILQVDGLLLVCTEWNGRQHPPAELVRKPLKKPDFRIFTKILKIGSEVSAKVVEHLPTDFAKADTEPTFAVQIADDEDVEDYIHRVSIQIKEHCKNKEPSTNVVVSNEYFYKYQDEFYRARLLNPSILYLLDAGFAVDLVAENVFDMKSIFTSFPATTAICKLEGVTWKIRTFKKFRSVMKQCCGNVGSLKLVTTDFKDGINYVAVFVNNDNLATLLQEKGLCKYETTTGPRVNVYNQKTMYEIREEAAKKKLDAKGRSILRSVKNLHINA